MKDQFFPNQLVPVYDVVVRMGVSRKLHHVPGILSQYCMLHLVQENQTSVICGHFQTQRLKGHLSCIYIFATCFKSQI